MVFLQVNLKDTRCSQIYQIELESLPFAIGHHTNQNPPLLTRVILSDIKRFSKVEKAFFENKETIFFFSSLKHRMLKELKILYYVILFIEQVLNQMNMLKPSLIKN